MRLNHPGNEKMGGLKIYKLVIQYPQNHMPQKEQFFYFIDTGRIEQ
jgi:hypothetical protein